MRKPTMRISGPPDVLQAVPYLLGFHPTNSLVLLGLADRELVVTARVDLPELAEPRALSRLIDALARGGARDLLAVVYGDGGPMPDISRGRNGPGWQLPWAGLVPALEEECERCGCELGEALYVAGGRWWSYLCDGDGCCPRSGTPLPEAPSEFVAEATFAGMVALPDRAAVEAMLDPVAQERLAAVAELVAAADRRGVAEIVAGRGERAIRSAKRAIFAAARKADAAAEAQGEWALSDAEVARLGSALTQTEVRDAVWIAVDGGRLDGRPLWRELARRLPGRYAAAPLFLFGWGSWRAGNGALAVIAVDRTLERDPGYGAADLLRAALTYGLNPNQVPKLGSRRKRVA
jgi:hypothetical protein